MTDFFACFGFLKPIEELSDGCLDVSACKWSLEPSREPLGLVSYHTSAQLKTLVIKQTALSEQIFLCRFSVSCFKKSSTS